MSLLQQTDHATYCPYKGDASYYSIATPAGELTDAVWRYVTPYPAVASIAGHVAFYANRVARDDRSLMNVVFHLPAGFAEGVNVATRIALYATDLVLVLRNHHVSGVRFAFWAVRFDVRADFVDFVFEHEVHSRAYGRPVTQEC
jgi:hypothetical protein